MFDLKFGFLVKNYTYTHLGMCRLLKFDDSRHAQLSIYTVFHEESEFEVESSQF